MFLFLVSFFKWTGKEEQYRTTESQGGAVTGHISTQRPLPFGIRCSDSEHLVQLSNESIEDMENNRFDVVHTPFLGPESTQWNVKFVNKKPCVFVSKKDLDMIEGKEGQ